MRKTKFATIYTDIRNAILHFRELGIEAHDLFVNMPDSLNIDFTEELYCNFKIDENTMPLNLPVKLKTQEIDDVHIIDNGRDEIVVAVREWIVTELEPIVIWRPESNDVSI